jgi:PhnB protein
VTSILNPYLSFRDEAKPAMEFYRHVFGGALNVSTFGEFGDPAAPEAQLIMHAQLTTDAGFTLMGADTPPGQDYTPGGNFAVSLSGDDADDLRGYWTKLMEGGEVHVPLERQMWGDEFGQGVDRFGVAWMVNIAGDTTS